MFKKFFKKLSKLLQKDNVNVIAIDGVIGGVGFKQGVSLTRLNDHLEAAFEGKNTKAVVLLVNSPGGSPVQSELIAKRVKQLSKQKNIPVISFIEDVAASGGYWIACAADEIISAENAIIGSLGVIYSGFGFNKAIDKYGIERRVYTSGDSKALLDPFSPEKPADIKIIKKVQEDIYQNFKLHVNANRKEKLKLNEEELFSGAIWSGKQAVEVGLVDKLGDLYSEMYERFGDKLNISYMNHDKSWLKRKLGVALDSFIELLGQFIATNKKIELR